MADKQKFKSELLFDEAHRLTKLYKTEKGSLMGDFGTGYKMIVNKAKGEWAKDNEFHVQLVPIKYTKIEGGGDLPPIPKNEPKDDWG